MINDGGPAFPGYKEWDSNQGLSMPTGHRPGMTLRDFFAAKAMQSLIAHSPQLIQLKNSYAGIGDKAVINGFSEIAFEYADAMIAQREVINA